MSELFSDPVCWRFKATVSNTKIYKYINIKINVSGMYLTVATEKRISPVNKCKQATRANWIIIFFIRTIHSDRNRLD